MVNVRRILILALRAAVWRTTPDPPLVGLPVLLGFAATLAVVRTGLQSVDAGSWHHFNPYGLNAVVAWLALELAVAALVVRPATRSTALSALAVLAMISNAAETAIKPILTSILPIALQTGWAGVVLTAVIYAVTVAWWIGAMTCIVESLEAAPRLRVLSRVVALWGALFVANALVPHAPVFIPPDFDARAANWWEVLYALHQERTGGSHALSPELARLEQAQPTLLQTEVSSLAPQRPGVTDVYALGIAGWGEQNVFVKELDGGLEAIGSVLPIKDHTLRLINNRDTLQTVPLADMQNFQAAVHAIGQVMDKAEDVLVLMMTSHGEQTGFALELPSGPAELTPRQVADVLDKEGIKNRVIIVSACFSGIFVPPLANDNTIVITAADAKNTSFGCTPESDWTYFGDAFFRQSLHPGSDFENSFNHARILIQGWELMDRLQPSNPQGHFGPAVVEKLAPYFATNSGQ
jgi:hypothetical protein